MAGACIILSTASAVAALAALLHSFHIVIFSVQVANTRHTQALTFHFAVLKDAASGLVK